MVREVARPSLLLAALHNRDIRVSVCQAVAASLPCRSPPVLTGPFRARFIIQQAARGDRDALAHTRHGHHSGMAPHALLLPYPAQGHVIPFMELAHLLLDRGFAVTFVNTDFNHRRVVDASAAAGAGGRLCLVGVADGMREGEDRDNLIRLNATMQEAVPPQLDALLDGAAGDGEANGKVTCVVVDVGMSWALDAAKRRGLPTAALWPASAAVLAVLLAAKKLIRDGVIDDDGALLVEGEEKSSSFRLAESAPPMDATFLAWNYMMGSREAARMVFHYLTATAWAAAAKADVLLCNTFADLEPAVFAASSSSSILPIGPLRTWQRDSSSAAAPAVVGHFWRADEDACLAFLDAQPHGAVVYVAFGSLAVMSPAQLEELGAALGASGRPFLWVLRPGLAGAPAAADLDGGRGKVVGWAPQERVLAHPAVGCFLTHCGWNSTLEGVRAGVPLLCWPYFTDQFANQTYICDVWRVGLRVAATGEDGGGGGGGGDVVSRERILERMERLMGDGGVKERVRRLKGLAEKSMSAEGRSLKNLKAFIDAMEK